ncbi:hypothetical protein SAMN05192553_11112 [Cyclobacterium xiamenense]|uniref:Uncharacterized protein n=1 Tax=Cyclobacterium xiamenense TaxID=1297121 RepID=A0A1H7BCD6_9BACT|nr:hypothetical protein [Cyclobacterium xiamenense]SEJ74826.1 hypothetical protein SAMN05192553_11112 [Cyclobacterium xiamenense]
MDENDAAHAEPDPKSALRDLLPEAGYRAGRLQGLTAVFNGLGIGLFLGLLMGLSVSPVVSGVIGTITSLLAVLIGLNEKFLDPVKSLRIGSFGLFSAVGILLGLYIRSNDPFAPSLSDKMQEYLEIGYSPEEAKVLVTNFIRADSSLAIRQANVLYSDEISITACDLLVYADPSTPASEVFNTFETAGGLWAKVATSFRNGLSEGDSKTALLLLRDGLCAGNGQGAQTLGIPKGIQTEQELPALEQQLRGLDAPWPDIVRLMEENFPAATRQQIYSRLVDELRND